MRFVAGLIKWLIVLIVAALVGVAGWLYFAPPALIRVATGYSAKMVCSNVFIAGRDADEVLKVDVQAPGHPVLRLVDIDIDQEEGIVSASLFGLFGRSDAIYRGAGLGCASVPDGEIEAAQAIAYERPAAAAKPDTLWPQGEEVATSQDPRIAAILDDADLTGAGMRAVVVVHNGRIVGERYGEGFDATTPLLGWSMTKTVTAAIIGTLVGEGRVERGRDGLFEAWSSDDRDAITLADLTSMTSGLEFNEDYGDVTDVTRMLYLEPDMAGFAVGKPQAGPVGGAFSYSTGSSVIASRAWQDTFDDPAQALAWPRQALFAPLGMDSALIEADATGTLVGSSYMYATARDWARFGLFLLRGGEWNGAQLLPEGYVDWMREEMPASNGEYANGSIWLHGPNGGTPEGEDPDAGFDLPDDAFWLIGHDGQSSAVVPSRDLVVLRLGLTPSNLDYKPQAMLEALVSALE